MDSLFPQRKIESKSKKNQRILKVEKNRKKIFEKEKELLLLNSKTVDYEKFKAFLIGKNRLNQETSGFYRRDTWRKMKFRAYSYGNKKSIDKFLNNIKKRFGGNL